VLTLFGLVFGVIACLLSGYMNKRDANQGACTNACRWEYNIHEAAEDASGDVIPVQSLETASVCCNNKDADEQHAIQQHQFGEPFPRGSSPRGSRLDHRVDRPDVEGRTNDCRS
jgi:hypothetical protein